MRSSNLAAFIFTIFASVEAVPRAYSPLPFFGAPRPVPGPKVIVRSPFAASQAPAPVQPASPGIILPAASPVSAVASATTAPFFPLASPPSNPGNTVPAAQAPPPSNPGNTAPAAQAQSCAADVDRLASGIQQNILDQQGELATAQSLLVYFQAAANGSRNGVDPTAVGNTPPASSSPDKNAGQFIALKGQLLAFVNAGIAIRTGNQAIAPSRSLAINGLAKVANAQQTELALASSLTGDATIDVATIRSLLKMFQDGTKQNMQNLLDGTQSCTPTDIIAQRGVQVALRAGLKEAIPGSVP